MAYDQEAHITIDPAYEPKISGPVGADLAVTVTYGAIHITFPEAAVLATLVRAVRAHLGLEDPPRCRHGWKGAAADPIETPCPSCGLKCLFVGSGGHLTCGNLSTCKEPGVERTVAALRQEIDALGRALTESTAMVESLHKDAAESAAALRSMGARVFTLVDVLRGGLSVCPPPEPEQEG